MEIPKTVKLGQRNQEMKTRTGKLGKVKLEEKSITSSRERRGTGSRPGGNQRQVTERNGKEGENIGRKTHG